MTFNELKIKAKNYPLFKLQDVFKWFPKAKRETTLNQLNFWTKKGYLENITRGIYRIIDFEIKDPFVLANFIYSPSYLSLETALNYYSLIPDVPFGITAVTINKTKILKTKNYGIFYFHCLKPSLFFGFQTVLVGNYSYNIATPEKALFDYFYLKAGKTISPAGFIEEARLSLSKKFNFLKIKKWSKFVTKQNKNFHQLVKAFLEKYGQ